jgi:hypothetical protein
VILGGDPRVFLTSVRAVAEIEDSDDDNLPLKKRLARLNPQREFTAGTRGPTPPLGGEDEDEDEEHATPATDSPAVRSKRAAEAGGIDEHVRRARCRNEADQSLRAADADAAADPNGGRQGRKTEITNYAVVKAPGGWPTGDPASVLGKGFLFHINLHSWGNYARRHGESYLRVADEREEED